MSEKSMEKYKKNIKFNQLDNNNNKKQQNISKLYKKI